MAGVLSRANVKVVRRRTWAPAKDDIGSLRRSAKQLARSAASQIAQPEVMNCLRQIRQLRVIERACQLLEADRLVELIDQHGLRPIDLARELGDRSSDISEKYHTAKVYPPALRPEGAIYNHLMMAGRMVRKYPKLRMSPAEVLVELQQSGLTQHRDVARHFGQLAAAAAAKFVLPAPRDVTNSGPFNRTYHCRFQELLPLFPKRSIQLLHIDPPYVYDRRGGGYEARLENSRSDYADPKEVIGTVTDLLRDWLPKLAPGGVVLLWQPWGSLRTEYHETVRAGGWDVFGPIIWDKGRPQPGNLAMPYAVQGESIWMLFRAGDRPLNHDGSPRHSILRFPPLNHRRRVRSPQQHAFEKPMELLAFLVRKHTRPGDLIFDACGCTGAMSVAAINGGRRWVYAESNADNYALGSRRIAAEVAKRTSNAAAG